MTTQQPQTNNENKLDKVIFTHIPPNMGMPYGAWAIIGYQKGHEVLGMFDENYYKAKKIALDLAEENGVELFRVFDMH